MNNAEAVRAWVLAQVELCDQFWTADPGKCGAINGAIQRACASVRAIPLAFEHGTKTKRVVEYRHLVLGYLFSPSKLFLSSTQLTREQWYALYEWIGFYNDTIDGWQTRPEFVTECGLVLSAAEREDAHIAGQMIIDLRV